MIPAHSSHSMHKTLDDLQSPSIDRDGFPRSTTGNALVASSIPNAIDQLDVTGVWRNLADRKEGPDTNSKAQRARLPCTCRQSNIVRKLDTVEGFIYTDIPRTFTPVPKRLLDGSEEGDALPAAVLSGAPIELQARTVR